MSNELMIIYNLPGEEVPANYTKESGVFLGLNDLGENLTSLSVQFDDAQGSARRRQILLSVPESAARHYIDIASTGDGKLDLTISRLHTLHADYEERKGVYESYEGP